MIRHHSCPPYLQTSTWPVQMQMQIVTSEGEVKNEIHFMLQCPVYETLRQSISHENTILNATGNAHKKNVNLLRM